jgi:hypothetical protein
MQGAFYRFQFLLLSTILCAILTIVWYCLSQIYETSWVWDTEKRPKIHYSGAFITGKKTGIELFSHFNFIDRNLWYVEYICFCCFGSFLTCNLKC